MLEYNRQAIILIIRWRQKIARQQNLRLTKQISSWSRWTSKITCNVGWKGFEDGLVRSRCYLLSHAFTTTTTGQQQQQQQEEQQQQQRQQHQPLRSPNCGFNRKYHQDQLGGEENGNNQRGCKASRTHCCEYKRLYD